MSSQVDKTPVNDGEMKILDTQQADKLTTVDSTTRLAETTQGTTIANQDKPRIITRDQSSVVGVTRALKHLNDSDWTLKDQMDRFNLVKEFAVDVSTPVNEVVFTADVPNGLIKTQLAILPFSSYQAVHFDSCTIRFQIAGNRFLQGRLIGYFHPTMKSIFNIDDSKVNLTRKNRVLLQHVVLDTASSESAEFIIPFAYNKGWLNYMDRDSIGQFSIAVLNQLSAATGTVTSITVKVQVMFNNVKFRIPIPDTIDTMVSRLSFLNNRIKEDEARISTKINSVAQSALLGDISSVIEEGTKALLPIAQVVDMIGTILDKKQIGVQYAPIITKDQQFLSNSKNDEFTENLLFDPSQMQLVDHEHFGTSEDELSIGYFTHKKWNLVNTFQYTTTSAPGTVLYQQLIGPFGTFDPNVDDELNTIDYIARRFAFWRGSYVFGLDFVTSQFHEGRIVVCFLSGVTQIPASIDTPEKMYEYAQSQYNVTVQIKGGQNTFCVRTPYLANTPYKRVCNGIKGDEFFSGTLLILADTPLKIMSNQPTTVDVNLYMAGGDDFNLIVPTFNNSSIRTNVDKVELNSIVQSSSISSVIKDWNPTTSNISTHMQPISFSDPPNRAYKNALTLCAFEGSHVSDPTAKHYPDQLGDLQQILKRYTPSSVFSFSLKFLVDSEQITAAQSQQILNGRPLLIFLEAGDQNYQSVRTAFVNNSFLSDIAPVYRLQRNPMVYKVKGTGNFTYGIVTYLNDTYSRPTLTKLQDLQTFFPLDASYSSEELGGPPMPNAYFSPTQVGEFKVPFMHAQATAIIPKEYDIGTVPDSNATLLIAAISGISNDTDIIKISVTQSFADEARFGVFQGLPRIKTMKAGNLSYFPDNWFTPTTASSH